jgi:iron uptake system component EfeO
MAEQLEKVTLAATGEDESRYSQATLADMRANLEGGRAIYAELSDWVRSVEGGADIDDRIMAGFDRIEAAYDAIDGGQLFLLLSEDSDPGIESSLVSDMNRAADLIGIPVLP